jgi:hypothetical protein
MGMVWYCGVTGIAAVNAFVTLQPDGSYTGTVSFFDRQGNTVNTGTTTVG